MQCVTNKVQYGLHQFERNISIEKGMDKIYKLCPKICNPHNCVILQFWKSCESKDNACYLMLSLGISAFRIRLLKSFSLIFAYWVHNAICNMLHCGWEIVDITVRVLLWSGRGVGLDVSEVKLKAPLTSFRLQASSDAYATVSPQLPTALYQTLQQT